MGKPLMIQLADDRRIEELKKKTGAQTKIEVVRAGLDLLEKETHRRDRIERWKKSASLVSKNSSETLRDFQKHSRIKRIK